MTILETRFMETIPSILRDLVDELRKLRKELERMNNEKENHQPEE